MSLQPILALIALILCIIHAVNGRVPLWFAVLLLALTVLLPAFRLQLHGSGWACPGLVDTSNISEGRDGDGYG